MAIESIGAAGASQQQYIIPNQYAANQLNSEAQQVTPQQPEGDATVSTSYPAVKQPSGDQVQIKSTVAAKNLDTLRAIEQMHARINELAKGTRETNEGLAKTVEKVDLMKTTLEGITKNFPPFSVESQKRQEILMSYVSIRKEIERLMVPAPPPPVYEQAKRMWEDMFSQNGQILPNAVPQLTETSSDQQVKAAVNTLDITNNRLAELSTGITQSLIQH